MSETEPASEAVTTAALVGAAGGAGTTRTAVEVATTLAREGRSVAVLDAAFATQGLAGYVEGRIDPDLTSLLTDEFEAPLEAGLSDLDVDVPGRVACCPVRAPFERLARAKAGEAARRFRERVDGAASTFDHVLVDTPPVAANQAVAGATACERVAIVAPASERGADAVGRERDRLADLDVGVDVVATTRGGLDAADVALPETDARAADEAPVCERAEGAYATAIARLTEELLDCTLESAAASDGLLDRVGGYVTD
jgi:hypothetical protein